MQKNIKVLIIDDSALVRSILSTGLSKDDNIEVVGTAPDVFAARDQIVLKKPDVLTLDVEMPRMDGVEFLKRLMPQYPIPVVMVSSMTAPNAKVTIEALEAGAIDFVLKPTGKLQTGLYEMMTELISKIRMAAKVDVSKWKDHDFNHVKNEQKTTQKILKNTTNKVIAIGASTGGTVAITKIVCQFPADIPGTVIVQHMPPNFTRSFANRLNEISLVEVKEAESGDRIIPGRVLIAPGGLHMKVRRSGGDYIVSCHKGENVNGHCPSVEVLFESVAEYVGSNAIGVMLTGMGRDGATGLLNMRQTGARTMAQDEKSSIVFGMPKEAWECGGAEELVSLENINRKICQILILMKN